MTPPRMRRELLRRADLLIALTEHEASFLRSLAPHTRVKVVANGVDPLPTALPDLSALGISRPYVVLLGTVSRRKQQVETLLELAGSRWKPVVIGGIDGTVEDTSAFHHALERSGGRWLGDVSDPQLVRSLLTYADALVHLSRAEGQSLAVLESLSVGTPVICSDLPANRELDRRYPGWVSVCSSLADLVPTLARPVPPARARAPKIDAWSDVAAALVQEYQSLGSTSSSLPP